VSGIGGVTYNKSSAASTEENLGNVPQLKSRCNCGNTIEAQEQSDRQVVVDGPSVLGPARQTAANNRAGESIENQCDDGSE
jgi:hypothetical protein